MADPKTYILDLKGHARPAQIALPELVVSDIHWYNANRASKRRFNPVEGIRGAVIHATAGSSSGGALAWWKTGGSASAHWVVPDENEELHGAKVLAVVYEALAAWHVRNDKSHPKIAGGAKLINHWTLGIEIVNLSEADPYSEWQVGITAEIVRYCWGKYPNFRWVFSHAAVDPGRRRDPGKHFPWDRFRRLVLGGASESPSLEFAELPSGPGEATNPACRPCLM